MRALAALMMLGLVALSGCLDDEPAPADDTMGDEPMDEEPAMETEVEDFGLYTLDPETGQCDVKEYTEIVPGQTYTSSWNGGTGEAWFWAETNGVPGLQVQENGPDPTGQTGALGVDARCVGGDQLIV